MTKRPYDLPPLSTLTAFEAAARHVSFKAAANELNVTPAAISHQVKSLENELMIALFNRNHRGVELTESGAYLYIALQRGFEGMNDALNQLRLRNSQDEVRLRVTSAVSSLWVMPRLSQFWRKHPDISVAQIVTDIDQGPYDCDLSIHYGDLGKQTGNCRQLFQDKILALGSPEFAKSHNINSLEDLVKLPLIHLDPGVAKWTSWKDWCEALGYSGELITGLRVNNYLIALQAARDGMGAVLGWDGLTNKMVADGKLVPLIDQAITSPLDFYVKLHSSGSKQARTLYNWLADHA